MSGLVVVDIFQVLSVLMCYRLINIVEAKGDVLAFSRTLYSSSAFSSSLNLSHLRRQRQRLIQKRPHFSSIPIASSSCLLFNSDGNMRINGLPWNLKPSYQQSRRTSPTKLNTRNRWHKSVGPLSSSQLCHSSHTDDTNNSDNNDADSGKQWMEKTFDQVITESISMLQEAQVTEPDQSVFHLLASSLNLPWETGFLDLSRKYYNNRNSVIKETDDATTIEDETVAAFLTLSQAQDYSIKLHRRLHHEPIQYILGQWDFLDYTVTIRSPLLCPRPETEELVMKVVEETTESPIHILDVGCGTGVIGLSLAEKLPDAFVEAIDIDPIAIQTSIENSQRILGATNHDYIASCYNVMQCSAEDYQDPNHLYDIVVSNPPYIPTSDMKTLSTDVIQYESESALCGGSDGLDVIRAIIENLPKWCTTGGICWMEVDPSHPPILRELLSRNTDNNNADGNDNIISSSTTTPLRVAFVDSYKDMFGKDRFVKLRVE